MLAVSVSRNLRSISRYNSCEISPVNSLYRKELFVFWAPFQFLLLLVDEPCPPLSPLMGIIPRKYFSNSDTSPLSVRGAWLGKGVLKMCFLESVVEFCEAAEFSFAEFTLPKNLLSFFRWREADWTKVGWRLLEVEVEEVDDKGCDKWPASTFRRQLPLEMTPELSGVINMSFFFEFREAFIWL